MMRGGVRDMVHCMMRGGVHCMVGGWEHCMMRGRVHCVVCCVVRRVVSCMMCCMMCCMMWSVVCCMVRHCMVRHCMVRHCMMCCMMDRVWGRGADVGRLVGRGQVVAPRPPGGRLVRRDHVRGRPHLASRRPALVAGVERRLLGRYNLWREGRAVADPVAVPELPVLPLGQRAAEAELGAARREGGAAV